METHNVLQLSVTGPTYQKVVLGLLLMVAMLVILWVVWQMGERHDRYRDKAITSNCVNNAVWMKLNSVGVVTQQQYNDIWVTCRNTYRGK